ncbi:MAG: CBS domain-containing protein [Sedimenticola sp.]
MSDAGKRVTVRDVMKTKFSIIDRDATILDALKMMKRQKTAVLVVERHHEDDEYGLLLVSDIAREVLAVDRSPERVNVYEVMAKPAIYVEPWMDIRYCSRLFARFDLIRALVVDDRKLMGTVSAYALVLDGMCGQFEV